MSETVIVSIGRSPIGRAFKGSLIDERPDDLGAFIADEVLKQVPQLDRGQIEDVICGCALPGGEQGHNVARIIRAAGEIGIDVHVIARDSPPGQRPGAAL